MTDHRAHITPFRQSEEQFIQLEEISSRSKNSQLESTETLLKPEGSSGHGCPLPAINASRKPFLLHPSMWMWEMLSLVLAAAILVTIVAILTAFDKKPSPVVGGITLNTVVAVAATLFRICLMVHVSDCICQLTWTWLQKGYRPLQDVVKFDMASRGPLGSLHLIFHVGFRYVCYCRYLTVSPFNRS